MADVVMPRLSDSMEEGTLLRWLRRDGEEVTRGEEIAEIETDKATMAYEADESGVLTIVAPEGSTLPVGAVIAAIGDPTTAPTPAGSDGVAVLAVAAAPARAVAAPRAAVAISASPVARRVAARLGIDPATLVGSGPGGRVLKRDVVAAADAPPVAAEPVVAEPVAPAAGASTQVELTRIQQVVARRMAESHATVPDFALQVDVDMRAALALREQLRPLLDPVPSVNDLLVKATAWALRRHPRVNGAYRGDTVEQFTRVNVGMAVATDTGLVVPTLHDADVRPLGVLAAEARRLAQRARDGELTPPELSGGTFTVSNLGMLGVDRFAGIVNPPQAAILCAGAIVKRPIADADDAVVVAPCLTLTLVCDHRVLDGADGARFLADVRRALEQPLAALTS